MTLGAALKQGFGLARRARPAVWVLFLVNLGLAALAASPIYRGIARFTGLSLMGERLTRGLPVDWLTDFGINSPGSMSRFAAVIALVGLISIPVNTILAGGVISQFRRFDQPFSLGAFARDSGRYAWRLIRLMLLGLVLYWVVFRLVNQSLGDLAERWTADWSSDRAAFWVKLGISVLLLLGLALINLVIDFARVKLVLEEATSAVWAFLSSLGFCLVRLPRALTVYAVPALCGLVLLGIYRLVVPWPLVNAPGAEGPWGQYREPLVVALLFIGQQVVMFARYWFRVATWACVWSYYSGSRQEKPTAAGEGEPLPQEAGAAAAP